MVTPFVGDHGLFAAAAGAALITTVFAAVYHAEVVAHRTGEPFGTLVLAVAVTVIEVALIVSVMLAAPAEKAGLARDTVFAAVMIVCNGIVGLCLLWGGARHHEQGFHVHGASAALAVLAALTTLTLIFPNVATSRARPVVQHVAARFRRNRVAGALWLVRVRPDRAAPRLLPARRARRRGSARVAALQRDRARQRRAAASRSRRRGRPCESSHADAGDRHSPVRCAKGRRRDRDRGSGSAARRSGGAQGGPRQPIADQLESGAGVGARELLA